MRKKFTQLDRDAKERVKDKDLKLKAFFYWWLESEHNKYRWIVQIALMLIIVLSIAGIISEITIDPEKSLILIWLNIICLTIFIIEYLIRFWINTDFFYELNKEGFTYAVKNKILWMLQPFSIIDLLSILPLAQAMRSFRMFRFIRLARLLRLLKIGRYMGLGNIFSEFKKQAYEFIIMGLMTIAIIIFCAIIVFCVEKPAGNENIQNIFDAVWWSIVTATTVGYGDIYPVTVVGRIVAVILMFAGIGLAGGVTAMVAGVIISRVESIKSGRIQIKQKGHILFCGYNQSAEAVLDSLAKSDEFEGKRIVVLSEKNNPERDDCIYILGNKNDINALSMANAAEASNIIIFSELNTASTSMLCDHENLLSSLQNRSLNKTNAKITIELINQENEEFAKHHIPEAELIHKELFDAALILNTIRNQGHTTEILYDLANVDGNKFVINDVDEYTNSENLNYPITVKKIKENLIENEKLQPCFFVAYKHKESQDWILNPDNDKKLQANDQFCILKGEDKSDDASEDKKDNAEAHCTSQNATQKINENRKLEIKNQYLFLGWNNCAAQVLEHLKTDKLMTEETEIKIISQKAPDNLNKKIKIIKEDFSVPGIIESLDFNKIKVIIIFSEIHKNETYNKADSRTLFTAIQIGEQISETTKLILEISDSHNKDLLIKHIPGDVEIILKNTIDADLIVNTIKNAGKTAQLWQEIANFEGNRLSTFSLSELGVKDNISLKELRLKLLDDNEPKIVFGYLPTGTNKPILNPPINTNLSQKDFIYILHQPD